MGLRKSMNNAIVASTIAASAMGIPALARSEENSNSETTTSSQTATFVEKYSNSTKKWPNQEQSRTLTPSDSEMLNVFEPQFLKRVGFGRLHAVVIPKDLYELIANDGTLTPEIVRQECHVRQGGDKSLLGFYADSSSISERQYDLHVITTDNFPEEMKRLKKIVQSMSAPTPKNGEFVTRWSDERIFIPPAESAKAERTR
jgi:hypothetical protein